MLRHENIKLKTFLGHIAHQHDFYLTDIIFILDIVLAFIRIKDSTNIISFSTYMRVRT